MIIRKAVFAVCEYGILFLLFIVNPISLFANVPEAFLFDPSSGARGNTYLNSSESSFRGFSASPFSPGDEPVWGFASIYGWENFEAINDIKLEDNDQTGAELVGNSENDYQDIYGYYIGFSSKFLKSSWGMGLAFALYMPGKSWYIDTAETYRPEYTFYRSKYQRPQISLSLSKKFGDHFLFGLGAFYKMNASGKSMLHLTPSSTQSSYQRVGLRIKSVVVPQATLRWDESSYSLGVYYHPKSESKFKLDTVTSFQVVGTSQSIPLDFSAQSIAYYDPQSVRGGGSFEWEMIKIFGEVWWWDYSKLKVPHMKLSFQGGLENDFRSTDSDAKFRDTVDPHAGLEIRFGEFVWGFGYWYEQSPLLSQTRTNLILPAKNVYTTGLSYTYDKILKFQLLAQWHRLKEKFELRDDIGAPGYRQRGEFYMVGGGLDLVY